MILKLKWSPLKEVIQLSKQLNDAERTIAKISEEKINFQEQGQPKAEVEVVEIEQSIAAVAEARIELEVWIKDHEESFRIKILICVKPKNNCKRLKFKKHLKKGRIH